MHNNNKQIPSIYGQSFYTMTKTKAIIISTFQDLLNNFSFTIEPAVYFHGADNEYQNPHLLDITVILHKNTKVETDIYYKDTNTQEYL